MTNAPLRPAVRRLLRAVAFRIPDKRACWILRGPAVCGLVVPELSASWAYLTGFRRTTLEETVQLGLVVLGRLGDPPPYSYGRGQWKYSPQGRQGRTITLTPAGLTAVYKR